MLSEFVGIQSELAIKRIYANTPGYQEALKFYTDRGFILSAFVPNNSGYFPYLIEMDCIMFNEKRRYSPLTCRVFGSRRASNLLGITYWSRAIRTMLRPSNLSSAACKLSCSTKEPSVANVQTT